MTGNDIYRAYDNLRPDDAAKERMLRNIQAACSQRTIRKRPFRGTLILAAALVLVLALVTTGFATEWFGLASLGQRQEPSDWGSGQETMLGLQGLADSPACQAAKAWGDWCAAYEPDPADIITPDVPYLYYGCRTEEMIQKLDELAAEYGLSLLPGEALFPADEAALLAAPRERWSAINSGMAVSLRLFDNYRYDERIFLDGVDHRFVEDMRQRGELLTLIDYTCEQAFSGHERPPLSGALNRFSIFARDEAYILRGRKTDFWRVAGRRALKLTVQYRTTAFLKVLVMAGKT